ncbi:unnamed protein product [Rhizoctonia solani]|nr:unnamed protein product [Rhizoctonia solani]
MIPSSPTTTDPRALHQPLRFQPPPECPLSRRKNTETRWITPSTHYRQAENAAARDNPAVLDSGSRSKAECWIDMKSILQRSSMVYASSTPWTAQDPTRNAEKEARRSWKDMRAGPLQYRFNTNRSAQLAGNEFRDMHELAGELDEPDSSVLFPVVVTRERRRREFASGTPFVILHGGSRLRTPYTNPNPYQAAKLASVPVLVSQVDDLVHNSG